MHQKTIPPLIQWANEASESDLKQWLFDRLHGNDRRWAEFSDGYQVPSYLISTVVRHTDTSAVAYAALIQSICGFIRTILPAWADQRDDVQTGEAVCSWTGPALVDLLFLASEILESGARRAEIRKILSSTAPKLPRYVGKLPLRAKALVALLDFGGHPDRQFWLAQISQDYPEATPIVFIALARRDLKDALIWLGGRSLNEQGSTLRKFRPSLVKMAGGEAALVVLIRQHLLRSNYPLAKLLRDELAPAGNLVLFLLKDEIEMAVANGWLILPALQSETGHEHRFAIARFEELDSYRKAALTLVDEVIKTEFGQLTAELTAQEKIGDVRKNILRSRTSTSREIIEISFAR